MRSITLKSNIGLCGAFSPVTFAVFNDDNCLVYIILNYPIIAYKYIVNKIHLDIYCIKSLNILCSGLLSISIFVAKLITSLHFFNLDNMGNTIA